MASSLNNAPSKDQSSDSGYTYRTGGSNDFTSCNEGDLITASDLFEFTSDDDRYIWAIQQDFTMIPGNVKDSCSNDWMNENTTKVKHRWDNGDTSGPTVTSHAPNGNKDGRIEQSVGIGTGGVNIG